MFSLLACADSSTHSHTHSRCLGSNQQALYTVPLLHALCNAFVTGRCGSHVDTGLHCMCYEFPWKLDSAVCWVAYQ